MKGFLTLLASAGVLASLPSCTTIEGAVILANTHIETQPSGTAIAVGLPGVPWEIYAGVQRKNPAGDIGLGAIFGAFGQPQRRPEYYREYRNLQK